MRGGPRHYEFYLLAAEDERFRGDDQIHSLRHACCAAPDTASDELYAKLQECVVDEEELGQRPDWLGEVVRHRDFFEETVLGWHRDGSEHLMLVVFVIANPHLAYLTPLRRLEQCLPRSGDGDAPSACERWHPHVFEIMDFLDNRCVTCIADVRAADLVVYGMVCPARTTTFREDPSQSS